MIAPMFGMIMLDRNVPNRWTCTRADVRGASVCVAVAIIHPFSAERPTLGRCGVLVWRQSMTGLTESVNACISLLLRRRQPL
jgi:hypothetical protein